jgi:hypothetical protein
LHNTPHKSEKEAIKVLKKILNKIIRPQKTEIKLYKNNLYSILWEKAALDSSKYVEKYLNEVLVFENIMQIWDYTIQSISKTSAGVYLEFGVFKGTSINYFSNAWPKYTFYGFDSFEGLAEDWKGHYLTKGAFNVDGKAPIVNPNVTLIKGWFNETLPNFILEQLHNDKLCCIHIDCDTYESTKIILNELKNHIKPGLLILFDEYFGYPNWSNGEYLAWQEFCREYNIKYRYKGFATLQALIEVT